MILYVDTYVAYLVLPKFCSRIAGYSYMVNHTIKPTHHNVDKYILIECKTLKHVVTSVAESKTSGIFHNAQISIFIRHILEYMGYP